MRLLLAMLAAALAAIAPAAAPTAGPLVLERVVLVQRHGVRPPVVSNEALAKYADKPWPGWPVPTGELTPHGGEVVRLMGETLRRTYVGDGLLEASGCPKPGEVQVWADGTDQRTRRSGEILAQTLAPGCGVRTGWAPPDPRDPIFGGNGAAACRVDPAAARTAILSRAGPGGLATPAARQALARLQAILAPSACAGGAGTCFAGEDTVEAGGYAGVKITGPIAETSSLAENLLLEYAEGMAPTDVAWGRAGAQDIDAVMPVHERNFFLILKTPYIASRFGAPMAKLILTALDGRAGAASGPPLGPKAKIVALAGHDSNLAFIGAVFGLDWALPGQPDSTAPAATLAFELWRDPATGARYVKPAVYYETLAQMRALAPRQAVRLPLRFDGCSGPAGACTLAELRRRAASTIPAGCGEPAALADRLAAPAAKP